MEFKRGKLYRIVSISEDPNFGPAKIVFRVSKKLPLPGQPIIGSLFEYNSYTLSPGDIFMFLQYENYIARGVKEKRIVFLLNESIWVTAFAKTTLQSVIQFESVA